MRNSIGVSVPSNNINSQTAPPLPNSRPNVPETFSVQHGATSRSGSINSPAGSSGGSCARCSLAFHDEPYGGNQWNGDYAPAASGRRKSAARPAKHARRGFLFGVPTRSGQKMRTECWHAALFAIASRRINWVCFRETLKRWLEANNGLTPKLFDLKSLRCLKLEVSLLLLKQQRSFLSDQRLNCPDELCQKPRQKHFQPHIMVRHID